MVLEAHRTVDALGNRMDGALPLHHGGLDSSVGGRNIQDTRIFFGMESTITNCEHISIDTFLANIKTNLYYATGEKFKINSGFF